MYHDFEEGQVAEEELAAILDVLESFLIRRFICNVPTHGLNRIFATLYHQPGESSSLLERVKQVLKDKSFPSDREFRTQFIGGKLYGGGERLGKARLILERLEASFAHKEAIPLSSNSVTIEHIMPQTLSDWWKRELGEEWEATHEEWLNTVGNLTLTGYNPELSNSDYPAKQAILGKSHLELNRYFEKATTWNQTAIRERGEALADIALAIWPDFSGRGDASEGMGADNETEREDVKRLVATVIERLGGELERLGSGPRVIAKVGDGKVVNIKNSKRHDDYYWFGLHASLWDEMGRAGVTHMVFILAQHGFLTVPVAIVGEYLPEAHVSPSATRAIRHYHVYISLEPTLELFTPGKAKRVSLREYYSPFAR